MAPRVSNILNLLQDAVCLLSVNNLEAVYINPAAESVLGFSPDSYYNNPKLLYEMVHPEDRKKVINSLKKITRDGESKCEIEFRILRLDGEISWLQARCAVNKTNSAVDNHVLCVLRDITESKRTELHLFNQLKFEKLVAEISRKLVNVNYKDLDKEIVYSLKLLGEFVNADRSYLFLYSSDGKTVGNIHEWCASGVESQIQNLKNLQAGFCPWWNRKMEKLETIIIPDASAMTEEASAEREILEARDIKSAVIVPVSCRNKLLGFLGFDSISEKKQLVKREEPLLNVAAEVIGNAISRVRIEEELRKSEEHYRLFMENFQGIAFKGNFHFEIMFIHGMVEEITGYTKKELAAVNQWDEIVHPEDRYKLYEHMEKLRTVPNYAVVCEYRIIHKNGSVKWVKEFIHNTCSKAGEPEYVKGVVLDITTLKNLEQELNYTRIHDSLTGLFNRTYFQEEMLRLNKNRCNPVGLIVIDVDGLKTINDAFGFEAGDAHLKLVVGLVKKSVHRGDILARIGGDELVVLLPFSSRQSVRDVVKRIKTSMEKYNAKRPKIPVSISLGFALKEDAKKDMATLFREANDSMYRHKLYQPKSSQSDVVQALTKTLEVKDYTTEDHANRLQKFIVKMGKELRLSEERLSNLRLLAQFHDIGKIGVPDNILFKPGKLTKKERKEIQLHSEIGYRIANSSPKLAPIADYILKHHEWWNGKGYILGLKGKEIPLECRILAVADAYDAMTSDRPYRKAMSHEQAVAELKKWSGKQFDPEMVSLFLSLFNAASPS